MTSTASCVSHEYEPCAAQPSKMTQWLQADHPDQKIRFPWEIAGTWRKILRRQNEGGHPQRADAVVRICDEGSPAPLT